MSTKGVSNIGQQIKVKPTTKNRIDLLKGADTYDNFICKMLTYFEETGITPISKIVSPVAAMSEAADRIIKVIRGIEKTSGATLTAIYNSVKNISSSGGGSDEAVNFSPEELQTLDNIVEKSKRLEKENAGYISEINELRNKLEISGQRQAATAGTDTAGINISKVREILDVLESKKKTSTFNPGIYEIGRNDFDSWMKRLKDELNK